MAAPARLGTGLPCWRSRISYFLRLAVPPSLRHPDPPAEGLRREREQATWLRALIKSCADRVLELRALVVLAPRGGGMCPHPPPRARPARDPGSHAPDAPLGTASIPHFGLYPPWQASSVNAAREVCRRTGLWVGDEGDRQARPQARADPRVISRALQFQSTFRGYRLEISQLCEERRR